MPTAGEPQARSQWQLFRRRFLHHKLAVVSLLILVALYAIVAFMDEQILRSQWSGRQQWMSQPLQLTYFNENTAGEGFFTRMQALEQRPNQAHVLEIYYLCLALGFRGTGPQWRRYHRSYGVMAAVMAPLVVSVHSVVGLSIRVEKR